MKFLKIFAIIVIGLVALFFIIGLFLPKTYSISRSAVIKAPDSVVYKNVSDFNDFVKWNPWSKMEPGAKTVVQGTPSQPGHYYTWTGKETGKGSMKIEQLEPGKMVDMDLTFIEPWQSTADTKFMFEPADGGTKVTWTMSGDYGTTTERWMGLAMSGMLEKQFDEGLKYLNDYSQSAQARASK